MRRRNVIHLIFDSSTTDRFLGFLPPFELSTCPANMKKPAKPESSVTAKRSEPKPSADAPAAPPAPGSFEELLARTTPKDRAAIVRHVAAREADGDPRAATVWKR